MIRSCNEGSGSVACPFSGKPDRRSTQRAQNEGQDIQTNLELQPLPLLVRQPSTEPPRPTDQAQSKRAQEQLVKQRRAFFLPGAFRACRLWFPVLILLLRFGQGGRVNIERGEKGSVELLGNKLFLYCWRQRGGGRDRGGRVRFRRHIRGRRDGRGVLGSNETGGGVGECSAGEKGRLEGGSAKESHG